MNTWVDYIRDDIKAHIATARPLPAALTLQGLSGHYAVSMTPIRRAVRELIADGYLYRRENGRLMVSSRRFGRPSKNQPLTPGPPRDYPSEIRRALAELSLAGKAVFVREEESAERFGVSTTAVRQVFHELAGAGLLEHIPRRGWRLRPFRRKHLDDYVRVRELLELEALDAAWPHLENDRLRSIYEGNVLPGSEQDWPRIDGSLHGYLIEKADNSYIRDFFCRHSRYYEILFHWESLDREAAIAAVRQHRTILDALLARDRDAARAALATHIRYSHPRLQEQLSGAQTAPL